MKVSILKVQTYLLYCLFFSVNFEVWDPLQTGGWFSLSKFFGILYFLSIIPNISNYIYTSKKVYLILAPLFIFYFILLILNIFNVNSYSSDFLSISILLNIFIFILILNHERIIPGVIEKAFVYFLLGALVSTIAYFLKIGVEVTIDGRVSLFGDDENALGFRMVVAFIILTYLLINNKENLLKFSLLFFLYFPIITLLLNTGSRLSVINLVLCTLFFVIFFKAKYIFNKALIWILFLFSSGYLIDLILTSEVVGKRLISSLEEGNLAGRDEIWKSILPLIENNIIFGVGQTGYIEFTNFNFGMYKSPHNVILEVLAYTGLMGLFFYLIFLFAAFFQSFQFFIKTRNIVPLVFLLPILGLLVSGQILVVKLGWFILAYAASRRYYI